MSSRECLSDTILRLTLTKVVEDFHDFFFHILTNVIIDIIKYVYRILWRKSFLKLICPKPLVHPENSLPQVLKILFTLLILGMIYIFHSKIQSNWTKFWLSNLLTPFTHFDSFTLVSLYLSFFQQSIREIDWFYW